jgi:hypothetical protein
MKIETEIELRRDTFWIWPPSSNCWWAIGLGLASLIASIILFFQGFLAQACMTLFGGWAVSGLLYRLIQHDRAITMILRHYYKGDGMPTKFQDKS